MTIRDGRFESPEVDNGFLPTQPSLHVIPKLHLRKLIRVLSRRLRQPDCQTALSMSFYS